MKKQLSLLCLVLALSGCVTHYQPPPQTVVYRDVHGLTSGVYQQDYAPVYIDPTIRVASSSYYYPGWSLDSFYYSSGYGLGYGYGYGFGGPYFSLSWSSGYYRPWGWYDRYYDPWWYGTPYRYGWYAPYRHYRPYRHHGYYAGYQHYGRGNHYPPYHSGYRSGRDNYNGRRANATLDPDWQQEGGLRQSWRGDDYEDRKDYRDPGLDSRPRNTPRMVMPAGNSGSGRGMAVRSRSQTKDEVTRLHNSVADQKSSVKPRQLQPRVVEPHPGVITRNPSVISRSTDQASMVRSAGQGKTSKTSNTPAPVAIPRSMRPRELSPSASPARSSTMPSAQPFTPPSVRQAQGSRQPANNSASRSSGPRSQPSAPARPQPAESRSRDHGRKSSGGNGDSER